jgi:hypothetical protein
MTNHFHELNEVDEFSALAQVAGSAVLNSEIQEASRALRGMWAIEDALRSEGAVPD